MVCTKLCTKCSIVKTIEDFTLNNVGIFISKCKECCNAYARQHNKLHPEARKAWRLINKEKIKEQKNSPKQKEQRRLTSLSYMRNKSEIKKHEYKLKYIYNMSLEDYDNLLIKQNNKCAICGTNNPGIKNIKNLFVDHCHSTTKVRGLLCNACNNGLGRFKDNIDFLNNAINYLKLYTNEVK